MTDTFTCEFIQSLIFVPAALLCYLPLMGQLRERPGKLMLKAIPIFLALSITESYIATRVELDGNIELAPILIAAFIFYLWSIGWQLAKGLAVFVDVMALMSVLANMAAMFDASRHSELGINSSTIDYVIFFLIAGALSTAVFGPFLFKAGRKLSDRLEIAAVWYMTLPFSGAILFLNIYVRPIKYETFYVNRIGSIALTILIIGLVFWALMNIVFYYTVMEILNASESMNELRIMKVKEEQYRAQISYVKESARARHDFRQTVATLQMMAEEGKIDSIRDYLADYIKELPENETTLYSGNSALNAVLNYYVGDAKGKGIDIRLHIDADKQDALSDAELCTLIGNLMENAIEAAGKADEPDRFIQLAVTVRGNWLYIVATNGFNGQVRKKNGKYISTKSGGSGYGLTSVRQTAMHHGGRAEFTDQGKEFHSDIAIPFRTN